MGFGETAETVSAQALLFEEFLAREAKAGRFALALKPRRQAYPGARPLPPEGLRRGGADPGGAAPDPGRQAGIDRELLLRHGRQLRL